MPYHPQSDGQTERMNRTLLDVLAKLARDKPRDWDAIFVLRWLLIKALCIRQQAKRLIGLC